MKTRPQHVNLFSFLAWLKNKQQWIINFNKQIEFWVYKYGGWSHDTINDGSAFISLESGF